MELTIEKALLAVQEFGLSPDNCEIKCLDAHGGTVGAWYEDGIVEHLSEDMTSILINIDLYKTTIIAIKEGH